MYEREVGQGRHDAARSSQRPRDSQQDEYDRSERGELTRQAPSSTERQEGAWDRGDQGGWTGYVVPYRYYGPGYRGVGYYSVMYQGSGDERSNPSSRAVGSSRRRPEASNPAVGGPVASRGAARRVTSARTSGSVKRSATG